jgi:hypothetical protein
VEVDYLPGVFDSPFSHSYLQLKYSGITDFVEVDYTFANGILPSMRVNETSTGIYGNASRGGFFWGESGPTTCLDALAIIRGAENLPLPLYGVVISNSNSFVREMLADAGIYLNGGPPNAIGWSSPILPYPLPQFPLPLPGRTRVNHGPSPSAPNGPRRMP